MQFSHISTCCIALILITVVYLITRGMTIADMGRDSISGFWQGHPSFCKESEVDMFCMYFEPQKTDSEQMCWILIIKKDQMIINHFTKYKLYTKMNLKNLSRKTSKPRYFMVEFNELPEQMKDEFPNLQNIIIHLDTNKLIMLKDNKVYFVGYKDSKITDLIDIDVQKRDANEEAEDINIKSKDESKDVSKDKSKDSQDNEAI